MMRDDAGRPQMTAVWFVTCWVLRCALLTAMFLFAMAVPSDGLTWTDVPVLVVETVTGAFALVVLGPLLGGGWGD